MYELYSKEMVSKPVINARSALSWSTKRTVLTHEVLRVLLNCRKLLPWERWERVVENVTEKVLRMQYSGYGVKFSKKAYREGERPLHRPREFEERGTRPRKTEEEKQLVQERQKRGGSLCNIYAEFTATEEIPERNKETRFQNQSHRKSWCCN